MFSRRQSATWAAVLLAWSAATGVDCGRGHAQVPAAKTNGDGALKAEPPAASQLFAPKQSSVEVPASQRVKVTCATPLQSYRADEFFADGPPEAYRGATIISRDDKPRLADSKGGLIEVEILADGPVVIAADWQSSAVIEDALKHEVWGDGKFAKEGWRLVDIAEIFPPASAFPKMTLLYLREAKAGEKFKIRTQRNNPPRVLVPLTVPDADRIVDWEPISKLPEGSQRDRIGFKFRVLLLERRFEALERWTSRYLKTHAMFPSGQFKIVATRLLVKHHDTDHKQSEADSRAFVALSEEWLKAMPDSVAARLNTAILLVALSEQLEDANYTENGPEVDELRRRALELLYEVERADPKIVDAYRTILVLADWARWSPELVDDYVERILTHCDWSAAALEQAFHHYTRQRQDESPEELRVRLRAFFDMIAERTRDRYGDAYYAAMIAGWTYNPVDLPMSYYGLSWPRLKASFEDWLKIFPNSLWIKQKYCYWACINGDRRSAASMFSQFTNAEADAREVWNDSEELRVRRNWASDDLFSGDQSELLEYPANQIMSARWRDDGRIALCDFSGSISLIDRKTGGLEKFGRPSSQPPFRFPGAYHFTDDGRRILYGTYYGRFGLTYLRDGHKHHAFWRPEKLRLTAVAIAPDERSFVVAESDRQLLIYGMPEGEWKPEFREVQRTIPFSMREEMSCVKFLDEGKSLLTINQTGHAELWDYADGKRKKTWVVHQGRGPAAVAVSRDGRRLATIGGLDQKLCIWSLPELELISKWPRVSLIHTDVISFSPDGKTLAAADGYHGIKASVIRLFDVASKQEIKTFTGHKASITAMQFLPDGKTLMSASRDMTIRFWKLPE